MKEFKIALYQIVQNLIRISLISAPIATIVITSPFKDEILNSINNGPTWLQILIAALVGGYLFTPMQNIGNIVWQMITIYFRSLIGAPKPGEKPYSERTLRFHATERQLRQKNALQIIKELYRPIAIISLAVAVMTCLLSISFLIPSIINQNTISAQVLLSLAATTIISFLVFFIGLLIIFIISIKVYYHQ